MLRRATQEFPDDQDLVGQLAKKYQRSGQPRNAERIFWKHYEESEKLSDKIRWAEELARLALSEGKINQLVTSFQERRKNNPQSIEPLLAIAQTHRIAENYEERRAALLEATRLKKTDPALLFEIARLEESEGDWEKAIQTLERASLLDKTNHAKQKIAQLYLQYGETKAGLDRMLEIAGGTNATADDLEKISLPLVQNKYWEELLDFLAPNMARFPNNYRLGFLSAIANEELGNTEAAKKQFIELLQITQEMPTLKKRKSKPKQSSLSKYKGAIPQSAIDLSTMLSVTPKYAYEYLQNNRSGGRYGPSLTASFLPSDLDSCRQFSLHHLSEIARDLTEQQRDALTQQLTQIGVENVNVLLSELSDRDFRAEPAMLLKIDPDNEATLALALLTTVDRENQLPQEVYLKGYEIFKEAYPALGFFAALNLNQTKPDNQTLLTKAVEAFENNQETEFRFSLIDQSKTSSIENNKARPTQRTPCRTQPVADGLVSNAGDRSKNVGFDLSSAGKFVSKRKVTAAID